MDRIEANRQIVKKAKTFCLGVEDRVRAMPSIHKGQWGDLKIETRTMRVWVSRARVEDGAPMNSEVQIEWYDGASWEDIHMLSLSERGLSRLLEEVNGL